MFFNKENNEMKKQRNAVLFLSFLLPLILMVAVVISKHVFPFGDKCILRTDFYHQYLPFYASLQYKLKNFKSLFYTYEVGLGTNFITIMAYYLICPLNILLLLVGDGYVLEYITVALIFKIALSGFTMSYYLVNKYKTNSVIVVVFAMFYAMSGYVAAYYWNIMWMDNIVLFPLLILGFENQFNAKKPYLYILMLALSILCNYYIGIIVCIFVFVYFIFYSVISEYKLKTIVKKFFITGIHSICGVLIASIILVPVIFAFKTTASSDTSFPSVVREYFSILEVLARHLPYVKVENGINYWPNIYCGVMCFGLIVLYFLSQKIKLKEKITYAILLMFFIASFSINVMDYVWHVCKFPNSLPCRQSFVYDFLILTICLKPLLKIDSIKIKDITIAFSIPIVLIMFMSKSVENSYVQYFAIYLSIVFLFVYMILFILYKRKNTNKNIVLYAVIVVIALEVWTNISVTSITTITRNDYMRNTDSIKTLTAGIKNITNDFYRVDRDKMLTKDDAAFMHYPSASIFSSSAYASGTEFYKQMGMEASTNAYSLTGSTPFADCFLAVKYAILESEQNKLKEMNRREIASADNVHLCENITTMPFAYVLTNDFLNEYDFSSGNPATNQNNFSRGQRFGAMLVKKNIIIEGNKAKYTTEEEGNYYAFIRDKGIKDVSVVYPTTVKTFRNVNRGYFVELGYLDKDIELEFKNDTNNDDLLMELFVFNYEVLKKVVTKINKNYVYKMNYFNETSIDFDMESKIDNGTCLITLPYDEGFTMWVDGNEVEPTKVFDFFLGVELTKGVHNIKLSYYPCGLKLGMILSGIGIVLFIIIVLFNNIKDSRNIQSFYKKNIKSSQKEIISNDEKSL